MAEKRYDVLAMGELLIDFTENAVSVQGNALFEANPGGAPCNVLAMLHKLGKKTAFLGKVGRDRFGILLKNLLEEIGISTEGLYMDADARTPLAFVHTAPDGDRDFSFYRNPGADMMLKAKEVREDFIEASKVFHFGTLSMTHEGVREATKKALKMARDKGLLISFDPNLRPPLWRSLEEAKEQMLFAMGQCDILKIADDEVLFVSGCGTVEAGAAWILGRFGNIRLMLTTLGREGSVAYYDDFAVKAEPFLNPGTIETTGAGDTFCACVLNYVLEHGLDGLTKCQLQEMLTFANAAASLITTRRGALKVMPEKEEVEAYMAGNISIEQSVHY